MVVGGVIIRFHPFSHCRIFKKIYSAQIWKYIKNKYIRNIYILNLLRGGASVATYCKSIKNKEALSSSTTEPIRKDLSRRILSGVVILLTHTIGHSLT